MCATALEMHSVVRVGILMSYPWQGVIKITLSLDVTFCSLVDLLNCTVTHLHYHNLNIFCFVWPQRSTIMPIYPEKKVYVESL